MKTQTINLKSSARLTGLTCLFFSLFFALNLYSQEYTKVYQDKFDVDKSAVLVIQNKYGDIQCRTWDENSVSVSVTVTVEAGSQEKADKILDRINVKLTGTRTRVEAVTSLGSSVSGTYSIDYEIRMPKWIRLEFDNKFGDIMLDETTGTATVNLEYGSMKANAFSGPDNKMTIKFSDVNAEFIQSGTVSMEYGKWRSLGTEGLTIYSRFSEFKIEKAAMLNIDSQYDDFNVGSAGEVIAVARFTDLEFERITGTFDFDIQYGSLEVDYISPDFKMGKVRNSFANVELDFDPKASFKIDADMKFGDLNYPKSNVSISKETLNYTTNLYKGKMGSSPSPGPSLSIISRNANATIRFTN